MRPRNALTLQAIISEAARAGDDLEHLHQQRRRPERKAVNARLRAEISEPGNRQAARIAEKFAPADRLPAFRLGRRQRNFLRIDLQRPGKRFARLAKRPMRTSQ